MFFSRHVGGLVNQDHRLPTFVSDDGFGVDRSALAAALGPPSPLRALREVPFAVMERTVAWRAGPLQLPFGDQVLALRRATRPPTVPLDPENVGAPPTTVNCCSGVVT